MESNDSLLDELRSAPAPVVPAGVGSVSVSLIDEKPPKDLNDPLAIPGPRPRTAVQKANDEHSTKAPSGVGKGFKVHVTGEYFAMSKEMPGKKAKKNYSIMVNLPSLDKAMYVLKHHVLDVVLRKRYADYVGFRTHNIVEAIPLSSDTPVPNSLQYVGRDGLCKVAESVKDENGQRLIDPDDYPDTNVLRDTIIDFTLNPKGFAVREARRQEERMEKEEIYKLNPELLEEEKSAEMSGETSLGAAR